MPKPTPRRRTSKATGLDIDGARAERLATRLVIEFVEQRSLSEFDVQNLRDLLHYSRTRAGAAEEIERDIAEGHSLRTMVLLLSDLPPIGPRNFETVGVDMPGGAAASRCTH
jgi:hypothetical protein